MDSYYAIQATSLPHFSGHYRQRGSGFGALAAGIGRVALHLARRCILPTAKLIGKELLKKSVPEIFGCSRKQKNLLNSHLKIRYQKVSKNRQGILPVGGSQYESSHRKQSTNAKKPFRTELQKKSVRFFLPE